MTFSYSFSAPACISPQSPYHDGSSDAQGQKKSSASDYETFIKLLVTQMKNQDPTEPVDATQYVSQLASFSAVEQAVQTNAKLEALLATQAVSQAGHYVGKQLSTEDGSVCGIVESVTIYGDGLVATLDNGEKLMIGPGVRVSQPSEKIAETTEKPAAKTDEAKPA